MLERGLVVADGDMLMLGPESEASFGRRNFLELLSVFTTPPLVEIRHGRSFLGQVHQSSFVIREGRTPVLLLGGRSWELVDLDWKRRIAYVLPVEETGRSRWVGSGPAVGFALAQAVKAILSGENPESRISRRADVELTRIRDDYEWLNPGATHLVTEGGRGRWWTFGGTLANHELRWRLGGIGDGSGAADELSIPIREGTTASQIKERLASPPDSELPIDDRAVDELKFSQCLPRGIAEQIVRKRVRDPNAVEALVDSPIFTARS